MATTKVIPGVIDLNETTSESGLKIPSGTNNNRPTAAAGQIRNNTNETSEGSASCEEYYNGTEWKKINNVVLPPVEGFKTLTYSGNGSTQSLTGVGFQPDLVWIKNRNGTNPHGLWDSVRGAGKLIKSDSSDIQTGNSGDLMGSFDADGFQVNRNYLSFTAYDNTNWGAGTYVGWSWKSGGNSNTFNLNGTGYATASAAGLTSGSLTPTGSSINTTTGVSIVTVNSGASTADVTVSHGLGVKPAFVLFKKLDVDAGGWFTWHQSFSPESYYLYLNADFGFSGLTQDGNAWGNQSFTSDVVSFRAGWTVETNRDVVIYSFAETTKYSKFGSYTGTGGANTITGVGFQPNWIMIKRTDSANDWVIFDSERDGTTDNDKVLWANLTSAEVTGGAATNIDLNSDGFSFDSGVTGSSINASGGNYVYVAFNQA